MTRENIARAFTSLGIVLSLVAYMLFLNWPSPTAGVIPLLMATFALCSSFGGLWVWHKRRSK